MDHVLLISTYELGRQPFGLASPAAWLENAGARVVLLDLAVGDFDPDAARTALMIGVYVPMHTATRMAEPILRRVREINPGVHVCVYGLYAPMNADHLRALGADSVIGGEFEQPLVDLYQELTTARADGSRQAPGRSVVSLDRQQFHIPNRTGLPALSEYAALRLTDGKTRTVGYTEASRGCKHLCRHCPIVPVYGGRFRIVQPDPVLADIRQQVAAGAEHITFGDPDFLNAPTHAMKIVDRLHDEFPELSYDVTIKVEHLRKHPDLIRRLKDTGCLLVTSAVESVDAEILKRLDKNHTADDLHHVLRLLDDAGLAFNPTFVAFTPWTTLPGYAQFLQAILRLELVDQVTPVQYGIRLLIPAGSRILELDDIRPLLADFDPTALAYPWSNPDPHVDDLHREVLTLVQAGQKAGLDRRQIFTGVWRATHARLGTEPNTDPDLRHLPTSATPPQLSEPWYCCAEPTEEQLAHL